MKSATRFLLLLLVTLVLSGCNSTMKQIKGSWYETNGYIRLDVDEQCTVNYYISDTGPVSKDFEYNVEENRFVLISDADSDVPLIMTIEDNIVSKLKYVVDDNELVFTKEEVESASAFEDLVLAMNDAQGAISNDGNEGEQNGQSALDAILEFGKARKMHNLVEEFLNELSPE